MDVCSSSTNLRASSLPVANGAREVVDRGHGGKVRHATSWSQATLPEKECVVQGHVVGILVYTREAGGFIIIILCTGHEIELSRQCLHTCVCT